MWNKRGNQFAKSTETICMWKDSNINSWLLHNTHLHHHLKSLNKLDLPAQLAILSRILYKHHNQMRRDKPFQLLKRAHKLATRYLDTGIISHLKTYIDIIGGLKKYKNDLAKDVKIPSEAFTCFLVECVYSTNQLLPSITDACEKAYLSLDAHMRHGFFVSFNLFAVATVSRVWSIFKSIKECTNLLFQVLKDVTMTCYPEGFMCSEEVQEILRGELESDKPVGVPTAETLEAIVGLETSLPAPGSIVVEDLGEVISRSSLQCKSSCDNIASSPEAKASPISQNTHIVPNDSVNLTVTDPAETCCNPVKNSVKRNRQVVRLGTFRSKRYHHLVPYPTSNAVARSIKRPFYQYIGVRNMKVMKKCYKIIRKQARELNCVEDVREALVRSASKQETLYLIMRLRQLLKGCKENELFY